MDQPDPAGELDAFLGVKRPPRSRRWLTWGLIAVVAVLLGWLGVRLFGGGDVAVRNANETIEGGNLAVTVSATATLQPINQMDVGSQRSGLATIDSATLPDRIDSGAAARAAAQADAGTAEATARLETADPGRLQQVCGLWGGKLPSAAEPDSGRAEAAGRAALPESVDALRHG